MSAWVHSHELRPCLVDWQRPPEVKMPRFSAAEQEIVKALIDTKAVDFEAIGRAFVEHGASATLNLSGEDFFCGTIRRFIRVYRLNDTVNVVEQLGELQQLRGEMQR